MKQISLCILLMLSFALITLRAGGAPANPASQRAGNWRALHVINYASDADLETLSRNIPRLAAMGINVLILEVNYNFDFKSHPELRHGSTPITKDGARKFASLCRAQGIRLIPEFQSLGHQSWKAETFPLLKVYPQLDLTPGAFPHNAGIYCRE